jgi:hypothetical protein
VCVFRLFKCRTDIVLYSDVMTHHNAVDELFQFCYSVAFILYRN